MEIILSILLSFTLLTAGLPMAEPAEAGSRLKLENQGIRASELCEINQDTYQKKLVLEKGETVEISARPGYHLEKSREIQCIHTVDSINAGILCRAAANPLNPTKNELENNVELTGSLKGRKYKLNIVPYDTHGLNNIVAHLRMSIEVDAPGLEGEEYTLATNYVCRDEYAAYAYFMRYFSYCPNTEKFYYQQSAHVWLGCSKGDTGTNQDHPAEYKHKIEVFKWVPNKYTVSYDANGGTGTAIKQSAVYDRQLELRPGTNLSREGYTLAGWNTKADGTGTGYKLKGAVSNLTEEHNATVTLYAQWEPKTYTVTLDNRLEEPDTAGTQKIYKKYKAGMFLDKGCSQTFTAENSITLPEKEGHKFRGYYNESGEKMTDKKGTLTKKGAGQKDVTGNETWHAQYSYLIGCEDYADVPCDMEKADGETREDMGVRLTYDSGTRKVTAITTQAGCSITLTGQPVGTRIGEFSSTMSAGSVSGNTGTARSAELPITIPEGAAYRLEVTKGDKTICSCLVYYRDGRFRTLVKLGEQETKGVKEGSSLAGSAWGTDEAGYDLYQYHGCSELEDIKAPGTVCRYFRYKDVNLAYSGNGATEGKNTLEYDVSLEDMYQFRDNGFKKENTETKYTEDEEAYKCRVKYSFQGWEMETSSQEWKKEKKLYQEKKQDAAIKVYSEAKRVGAISDCTTEDISTYQEALKAATPGKTHVEEYINLTAKWDACPTIVVTPGDKMEFYEGEKVTKEMLTRNLTAHDNEDNRDVNKNPDLNDRLRIIKIFYPEPENHSQAAYEKTYDVDVPEGFLLDTYYLMLEEDEEVDVLITFAVTDSAGNTTEEKITAKVKYNHYPEISSEDIFYYLKEEANRGEITEEALLGRASAKDTEDGDITGKLGLKDFDAQIMKMQTESKAEFNVTYQVTDAYRKTTYKTVKVMVWDEDAAIAEMPKYYVRYISEKYLDTLEENSTWREPENLAYLKSILRNEAPMETWAFTHEDVLAVQDWITEGGDGIWKIGEAANREFPVKFAHCRQ